MAFTARNLFINLDVQNPKQSLIQGVTNKQQINALQYTLGDMLPHNLYLCSTNPTTGVFGYDANSGSGTYSVRVGVGTPGGVPTSGTYTLNITTTPGTGTTSALAYNATAAQVQAAITALACVGAGNCTVTGQFPTYDIEFIAGLGGVAQSGITGTNVTSLYPFSGIDVETEQAGGIGTNTIQGMEIYANPVVLQEVWATINQNTVTGVPGGGTFTLSFGGYTTSGLAYNITAANLQTALTGLTSIGSGNCTVTGQFPNYVVTFGGTLAGLPQPLITANASSLTTSPCAVVIASAQNGGGAYSSIQTINLEALTATPIGWNGQLNFNTDALIEMFSNNGGQPLTSINPTLEIAVIDGSGNIVTTASYTLTIWHRVIDNAAVALPPSGSQFGTYTIPSGVSSGAVTGLGLAVAPSYVGVLGIARNTGTELLTWSPNASIAYTTDGFHFNLSGTTDTADYVLQYMLFF